MKEQAIKLTIKKDINTHLSWPDRMIPRKIFLNDAHIGNMTRDHKFYNCGTKKHFYGYDLHLFSNPIYPYYETLKEVKAAIFAKFTGKFGAMAMPEVSGLYFEEWAERQRD